jgi:predicted phage tail protein
MSESVRKVRLYGVLGTTFGREYQLAVSSAREAVRALCVIVPGFERFLNNSRQRGLTYAVFSGKQNLNQKALEMDEGGDDIRIAPVIIGSKRGGLMQTILGAALIAVAAFAPWGRQSGPVMLFSRWGPHSRSEG